MTVPTIHNENCDCPAGRCAMLVEPDTQCINRLTGYVRTEYCGKCGSHTWHQNDDCVRCRDLQER